jgi:hypothetical protein
VAVAVAAAAPAARAAVQGPIAPDGSVSVSAFNWSSAGKVRRASSPLPPHPSLCALPASTVWLTRHKHAQGSCGQHWHRGAYQSAKRSDIRRALSSPPL